LEGAGLRALRAQTSSYLFNFHSSCLLALALCLLALALALMPAGGVLVG
jgi:hypothetical protein